MTTSELKAILKCRLRKTADTLTAKNDEYAHGDALSNFKRAGKRLNCTPERALIGFMEKHSVALIDFIDDLDTNNLQPYDRWDEKIGDSIVYLILLEALVAERYALMSEKPTDVSDADELPVKSTHGIGQKDMPDRGQSATQSA